MGYFRIFLPKWGTELRKPPPTPEKLCRVPSIPAEIRRAPLRSVELCRCPMAPSNTAVLRWLHIAQNEQALLSFTESYLILPSSAEICTLHNRFFSFLCRISVHWLRALRVATCYRIDSISLRRVCFPQFGIKKTLNTRRINC